MSKKNAETDVSSLDAFADDGTAGAGHLGANVGGQGTDTANSLHAAAALIRAELDRAPAAQVTLRALVVELRPDLLRARRNGRSWKDIAATFPAAGFEADPDTIRLYVSKAVPTRAARAAKRTAQAAPIAAPASTAVARPVDPTRVPPAPMRGDGARIAPRVK